MINPSIDASMVTIDRDYLVGDVLEETVSVTETLGSETNPFARCGARQTHHVLLKNSISEFSFVPFFPSL